MSRELICISCPVGCRMVISETGAEVEVTGNRCSRGAEYAREELLSPKRVVTATVRLSGGRSPRLPVRSVAPVPRELIPSLLDRLYALSVEPPVRSGQAVLYGEGNVEVVATRDSESEAD